MKFMMQGQNSVAANTVNANVITGQRYERPQFDCVGGIYGNGSAAGLNMELNVGGVSITPPITVNAQNRLPVVPDDSLVDGFEVVAGSQLQVTVTNTTGGALTFFWRVELVPVEG